MGCIMIPRRGKIGLTTREMEIVMKLIDWSVHTENISYVIFINFEGQNSALGKCDGSNCIGLTHRCLGTCT